MLNSYFSPLTHILLPFKKRKIHMHPFNLHKIQMPIGFEDYESILKSLCKQINAFNGEAYMTVDEKIVEKGCFHRRPGPHVDGFWVKESHSHGQPKPPGSHIHKKNIARMPLILVSNEVGCRVWSGLFDELPQSDGDLSHVKLKENKSEILEANRAYFLSGDCIHESLPMQETVKRSLLRITLPIELK